MSVVLQDDLVIGAYRTIHDVTGASADDILVCPDLRNRFLDLAREHSARAPEELILRRLLNLRKRSKLPRAGRLGSSPTPG